MLRCCTAVFLVDVLQCPKSSYLLNIFKIIFACFLSNRVKRDFIWTQLSLPSFSVKLCHSMTNTQISRTVKGCSKMEWNYNMVMIFIVCINTFFFLGFLFLLLLLVWGFFCILIFLKKGNKLKTSYTAFMNNVLLSLGSSLWLWLLGWKYRSS